MKVLFVIHYSTFGGPHNQAAQLNEPLLKRGWQTTVLLPDDPGNAAARLGTAGVQVCRMPLHRVRARRDPRLHVRYVLYYWRDVARIRALIRSLRPDVLMIGGLVNTQAAVAARLERIPIVWQILDTRVPPWARTVLMLVVSKLADSILSTGTTVAAAHGGALAFGSRLITYFPPVDPSYFSDSNQSMRLKARKDLGIGIGELVVGNVSNINPQKGHRTFLAAASLLRRSHRSVRFVIVGSTYPQHRRYAEKLVRDAASAGLVIGRDVMFCDAAARVRELASAFDVFWMTPEPRSEGIPTVVEEAMALGLPVVATDAGGIRDVITHGANGLLAPTRRPEEVAALTVSLFLNAELRKAIGDRGRQWARVHCGVETCADAHVTALERALVHKRSGQSLDCSSYASQDSAS